MIEALRPKAKPAPRLKEMSYKQWLTENKLEPSLKAWTDYSLRGLPLGRSSYKRGSYATDE